MIMATSTVGLTSYETPSDVEIRATRVFNAPRALVFAAFTSPKHLPHWMLGPAGWEMTACEIDLRPGGAWHYAWRHADGSEMAMSGVYREVVPPERTVTTESWGEDWPETVNTLELSEEDGRTTITSTVRYPSRGARDAALRTGMREGMSLSFDRLAELLAGLPTEIAGEDGA
jgi:uncharacterized protein YndB with AHSA1/START domain